MGPVIALRSLLAAAAAAAVLAACGAGAPAPPPAAGADAPGAPALLRQPLGPGEVRVAGENSPQTHGPFRFDGRYLVRFAQYAPEAPGRSFAGQTPFVAELRPVGDPPARPVPLFAVAAERGDRTLNLSGRYTVEVSFGDFPYAILFTPRK